MKTREFPSGVVEHYDEKGRLHRIGAPAARATDGSEVWAEEGKVHRSDGPAVTLIFPGLTVRQWWRRGTMMRETQESHTHG